MAEGYSIVAYSDHEIMLPHNDLTDENFLAITAVEYIVNEPDVNNLGFLSMKTYHINLYAKDSEATVSPGFCEKIIWRKNTLPLVTDEMRQKQDSARYYGAEYVNDVIRRANEQGFLVCYCHPVWSLQNYEDYSGLKGLWGVEVFNADTGLGGFTDTVQPFIDLLGKGESVFPIASDDTHGVEKCFGGFVMVKADKLEYATVMTALEKGDFYASTAPAIYELSIENGILKIVCSDAVMVAVSTERRRTFCKRAEKGCTFQSAEFDINAFIEESEILAQKTDKKAYIRVTVKDVHGDSAWTRAYYLNELK